MHALSGVLTCDDLRGQIPSARAGRDADRAVTALYLTHYRPLVALAARLVRDLATAEEIVHDSFVAAHAARRRRPDADLAPSHLRRSVVDRSRSRLRQRAGVGPLAPALMLDRLAVLPQRGPALQRSAFISALWALPAQQREAMVLRYFADLPGTSRADLPGTSRADLPGTFPHGGI
jgi:DNA-directed RNA polymerase specialized sigma24 family protein